MWRENAKCQNYVVIDNHIIISILERAGSTIPLLAGGERGRRRGQEREPRGRNRAVGCGVGVL